MERTPHRGNVTSKPNASCAGPERWNMKLLRKAVRRGEEGKVGWVLLWLLGVPIPVIILLWLFFGR